MSWFEIAAGMNFKAEHAEDNVTTSKCITFTFRRIMAGSRIGVLEKTVHFEGIDYQLTLDIPNHLAAVSASSSVPLVLRHSSRRDQRSRYALVQATIVNANAPVKVNISVQPFQNIPYELSLRDPYTVFYSKGLRTAKYLTVYQLNALLNDQLVFDLRIPSQTEISKSPNGGIPKSLLTALEAHLNDPRTSDVEFRLAQGRVIYANSKFLSSRSDYFKTLLESGLRESSVVSSEEGPGRHVIDIAEDDPDEFYALLTYLYTNKTDFGSSHDATSLFAIADKYQVIPLRELMFKQVRGSVSSKNAARILFTLGWRYDDLRKMLVDYIAKHLKEVREVGDFKVYLEEYISDENENDRTLITELFSKFG